MLVGVLFCTAFWGYYFLAREQPDNTRRLVKAENGLYRVYTVSGE